MASLGLCASNPVTHYETLYGNKNVKMELNIESKNQDTEAQQIEFPDLFLHIDNDLKRKFVSCYFS